ncbi:hypothetical protein QBZ16_001893 [Prototheca wickerhamii]|uniref:2-(3-amino-3-carboxypropyl)histidine synthase subunit 2 n=1 Tax=Prototheca wickerhamii TaxID=3111 RepID=A0AAD9MI26_PROWI|nr:hypothetical protein QBZ16_001893 [Prototheca wickerhamii]
MAELATDDEAFLRTWDIPQTARYLIARGFVKPTLQFPDEMLGSAARVAVTLQEHCARQGHDVQAYILADTTYNSLSVDEVAAAHIAGDCVVHYGRASLTPLSRTPAYFVFPRRDIDVEALASAIASSDPWRAAREGRETVVCFLEQAHAHLEADLCRALESAAAGGAGGHWVWASIGSRELEPAAPAGCGCGRPPAAAADSAAAGYSWRCEGAPTAVFFVGSPEAPALEHLQLTHAALSWHVLDTTRDAYRVEQGLPLALRRLLRRRYALVERARAANIVGIVVGTLGAAGYLDAVDALCRAAEAAGKKTYTLLLGKPSPAKLANFPEIEVFVLVADPQGLILDCKEYLAPIISFHEAMLAFREGSEWDEAAYRLDFAVPGAGDGGAEDPGEAWALAQRDAARGLQLTTVSRGSEHAMVPASAADYLTFKRSWRGVPTRRPRAPSPRCRRRPSRAAPGGRRVAPMATAAGVTLGRVSLDDTALFVCDVQERFRPVIHNFKAMADTTARVVRAAKIMGLPIIVTEQYPKGLGHTAQEIAELLPSDALIVEKTKFSMVVDDVADFLRKRDDIKRVILVGIETHVCVLQTALDLVERGIEVHVLTDGVSSRTVLDRQTALHRLTQVGVFLSTSESILFQLMGNTTYSKFREVSALFKEERPEQLPGF